jgi:hypothetical protein
MMKALSPETLQHELRHRLGLDVREVPLHDTALLACTLRRAAAFRCPCPPKALVEDAERVLAGLVPDGDALREALDQVLESLLIFGDLIEGEAEESGARRTRAVYGAPLSYVRRSTGTFLLLGVFVDGVAPFTEDLREKLHHRGHLRVLSAPPGGEDEIAGELDACGYFEMPLEQWLRSPKIEPAAVWKRKYDALLDRAPGCGDLPGLQVLDPEGDRRYYRGRWVDPGRRSGRFVGRRPQRWGADLWVYVEVEVGAPTRFVDLPVLSNQWRGCDEAWHLQAALDHVHGRPQVVQVEPLAGSTDRRLRLYSPVPLWAQRRLDCFGRKDMVKGCLFAYRLPEADSRQETDFLGQAMWLQSESAVGR